MKKRKKGKYIYIYTYIHTNKKGNHESISFYMAGNYVAVSFHTCIITSQRTEFRINICFLCSFYPLSLCLHIYQTGGNIKVGTRLVLFTISALLDIIILLNQYFNNNVIYHIYHQTLELQVTIIIIRPVGLKECSRDITRDHLPSFHRIHDA